MFILILQTQLTVLPTGYSTKTAGVISLYVSVACKTSLRFPGIKGKVVCKEKIKTDK